MKEIAVLECEGCHQVFRVDQLREGKIGHHGWKPSDGYADLWDSGGFTSQSEGECIMQMAEWRHQQKVYEQRQEEARQRHVADEQRIIDACGADELLHHLLAVKNLDLARARVYQLAKELQINWDALTWDSAQWDDALLRRCFAETGFVTHDAY